MRTVLRRLIELQEVDSEMQALEAVKGDLPQQVEKLRREVSEQQARLEALNKEREEAKRAKLHWEAEVETLEEKLKKYQDQLYSVKTNKEYDAITVEIDATKAQIDEVETKALEAIEKDEQLSPQIGALKDAIKDLQHHLELKEKELEARIRETETEWRGLEKRRNEIIAGLNKPVLYQYERIRRAKGGVAVVGVNNYACEGCYASIPPQRVLEIRSMSQLILCESCGRILVHRDEKEAVAH